MNLTPTQEARKQAAKEAYDLWQAAVENRRKAVEEFVEKYDEGVKPLKHEFLAKLLATQDGKRVPVKRLAEDIFDHAGTTLAYRYLSEAKMASGIHVAAAGAVRATDSRFTALGDGEYAFRPAVEELEPVLEKLGLDAETAPREAIFRIEDGVVTPVTPRMTADGMHPVVAMMIGGATENRLALLEFAAADD